MLDRKFLPALEVVLDGAVPCFSSANKDEFNATTEMNESKTPCTKILPLETQALCPKGVIISPLKFL